MLKLDSQPKLDTQKKLKNVAIALDLKGMRGDWSESCVQLQPIPHDPTTKKILDPKNSPKIKKWP